MAPAWYWAQRRTSRAAVFAIPGCRRSGRRSSSLAPRSGTRLSVASPDRVIGEPLELVARLASREDGERLARLPGEPLGLALRELDRRRSGDQPDGRVDLFVGRLFLLDHTPQHGAVAQVVERPQHRQGKRALAQVAANRLAQLLLGPDEVEDVVGDLERHPQVQTVRAERQLAALADAAQD